MSDPWGTLGSAQGSTKTAEVILALLCVLWPEQEQIWLAGVMARTSKKHSRSVSAAREVGGTAHTEGSSPKKLVHVLQLSSLLGTTARAQKD